MPFRGYFRIGDPRGPLFGSGGATWPTCPPWRWRLGSQDATGDWTFLKTTGVLLEPWLNMTHDQSQWQATVDKPPHLTYIRLYRQWVPIASLIRWTLAIDPNWYQGVWNLIVLKTPGQANKTLHLGRLVDPGTTNGSTGKLLKAYQVEFDQENPPGGWPPWA